MSGTTEEMAVHLGEMLCARVCHDLAGAIGAVGGGAELLADELGPGNEALALLVESATAATSRLRFLRQAFSGGGTPVRAAQLFQMTSDYLASSPGGAKLALDWQDGAEEPWESGAARIALNLVLLAQDCLPRGGDVTVRGRPRTGYPPETVAVVTARGGTLALGEAAGQLLDPTSDSFGPRGAQGRYARNLADQLGLAIRMEKEEDRISFLAARKE